MGLPHPGGMTDISRWSSAATPPEDGSHSLPHPGRDARGAALGLCSRVGNRHASSAIPPGWVDSGDLLPVVSLRSTTG